MKKELKNVGDEVKKFEKGVVNRNLEDGERQVERFGKNIFDKIYGNVHPSKKRNLSFGQKAADWLAYWAGSWIFILGFLFFLVLWMAVNTAWIIFGSAWDKYPFILLNLVLSCLAALQAPVILMSQNRAGQRDRLRAEYDYKVNRTAEKEIRKIKTQLDRIERKMKRR